jgi:hypothetical protein
MSTSNTLSKPRRFVAATISGYIRADRISEHLSDCGTHRGAITATLCTFLVIDCAPCLIDCTSLAQCTYRTINDTCRFRYNSRVSKANQTAALLLHGNRDRPHPTRPHCWTFVADSNASFTVDAFAFVTNDATVDFISQCCSDFLRRNEYP